MGGGGRQELGLGREIIIGWEGENGLVRAGEGGDRPGAWRGGGGWRLERTSFLLHHACMQRQAWAGSGAGGQAGAWVGGIAQ